MKIFISADIEGITGITDWDEADLAKPGNAEFRQRMTAEVVAACEGAVVSGADPYISSIQARATLEYVQALQTSSDVNVLSTPHLLASDNEESEITVGQNVPFQAGYAPSGLSSALAGTSENATATALGGLLGGGGLNSLYAPIQRQNVELRLRIKPQISHGCRPSSAVNQPAVLAMNGNGKLSARIQRTGRVRSSRPEAMSSDAIPAIAMKIVPKPTMMWKL